jgi:imidazolonepropionase-like amidohydrolase
MRKVLRNCNILDVDSGRYSLNDILIQNQDIVKIVPIKQMKEVNDSDIDLNGMYTLPGLIDTHVHMSYTLPQEGERNHVILNNKKKTLMNGFTTVRDLAGPKFEFDINEVSPLILSSQEPILKKNFSSPQSLIDSLNERRRSDVIKVFLSDGDLIPIQSLQYLNRISRVPVAIHAMTDREIYHASRSGCRSIEHCYYANETNFFHNPETYVCPTFSNPYNYYHNFNDYLHLFGRNPEHHKNFFREVLRVNLQNISRLYPRTKIVFGTDAIGGFHGKNQLEFQFLKKFMNNLECIQCATSDAADMLYRQDLGRIREGNRADIIAVENNPLNSIEYLQDINFVMRHGKIFKY